MVGQPSRPHTNISKQAYQRRQTGAGHTYQERLKHSVQCLHCPATFKLGSLKTHVRRLHGMELSEDSLHSDSATLTATSLTPYRLSFPQGTTKHCPVALCHGRFKTHDGLRRHFMTHHPLDSLCILEEGGQPLPRCPQCDMHVSYTALNKNHPTSQTCKRGTALKQQRKLLNTQRQAKKDSILLFNTALPIVLMFCYLGRILASNNSDWSTLHKNLMKAKCKWALISRPLIRTGVSPRFIGYFYKAIVQSVLLYGSKTWTVTPPLIATLEGFHHRMARRIANKLPIRHPDDTWTYPPIKEALKIAGLYPITHYIKVRQNTITMYVATRPILQLCMEAAAQQQNDISKSRLFL
jgi:hypothetical protein